MTIEVFNESGYEGVNEEALINVATFALNAMDIHRDAEASIHIVDLDTIADLHVRWLDLEGPTDVMSFPMDELTPGSGRPDSPEIGPAMLGDIVLCPEFAARQAEKARHSLGHELALLTIHGCLHLLGYDHEDPADEQEMFALQNELLAAWYDSGGAYEPKPSGPEAFPNAADRDDAPPTTGGSLPAVGEPN